MTDEVVRLGQYYDQLVVDIDGVPTLVTLGQYYGELFAGDTKIVPGQLYDQLVLPDAYVEDAAATTLFAAMSSEPDQARKVLYNDLIAGLKADDNWDSIDILYLFAAHDQQAALLNIKNPATFTPTLEGTTPPAFEADRGFTTDGVDNYIDTTFNVSTAGGAQSQNSAHLLLWQRVDVESDTSAAGQFDGTDGTSIQPKAATNSSIRMRINHASVATVGAVPAATGLFYLNRSSSTARQGGRNGVQVGSGSSTSTALNDLTLKIGNIAPGVAGFVANQYAVFGYGGSRTEAQHLQIYNRILAYMTGVGAA